MEDPSGLKKRMKELTKLDDKTKQKMIENALKLAKTKTFEMDILEMKDDQFE